MPAYASLWLIFFIFNLLGTVAQQSLDDLLMKSMQRESFTLGIVIGLIVFTSLGLELLLSSLFLFVKSQFYLKPNWKKNLIETLGDLTRETLKGIGNASLWCFAGVIPGISRFIDYNFIPFVVFTNKDYQDGKVEVLSYIRTKVKPIKGKLLLFWILFTILLPILFNILFSDYQNFSDTPIKASLVVLLDSSFHLLWFSVLFKLYSKSMHAT
jgi:hypothetical protein